MNTIDIKRCLAILIINLFFFSCCKTETYNRPNIVFLLADDLGYNELGSYGQKIVKTPHLDALAKKSMKFTNFYAGSAVCSPSRAVLLTGKSATFVSIRGNAGYFGNDKWEGVALDKDEFTLGEMFRTADYQSAFIGKWHLDNPDEPATWAFSHGFDFAAQEQWTGRFGKRKFPNLVCGSMELQITSLMTTKNTIVKMLFTLTSP